MNIPYVTPISREVLRWNVGGGPLPGELEHELSPENMRERISRDLGGTIVEGMGGELGPLWRVPIDVVKPNPPITGEHEQDVQPVRP